MRKKATDNSIEPGPYMRTRAGGQIAPKAMNVVDGLRASARVNVFDNRVGADDRAMQGSDCAWMTAPSDH
jgi:hypothetical protein